MALDDGYYDRLEQANAAAHWLRDFTPRPAPEPYIWHWEQMEPLIREAAAEEALGGERRSLTLHNPAHKRGGGGTICSLIAAIQLIKPGEVATAHRHTATAIRFIMVGSTAHTVVNGEKVQMEEGDLVLTPSWAWHDHAHSGFTNEDMIWMDVLDAPLAGYLGIQRREMYHEDTQPVTKREGFTAARIGGGLMRGFQDTRPERALAMIYKWKDSYGALLNSDEASPFDGVAMEYVNPLNAGHTLPSMSLSLQRLRPGEHTRAHRHAHSVVYHAAQGDGFTIVEGRRMDWAKFDIFALPPWTWHEHGNASQDTDAVLFSLSDLPVVEAVGMAEEEEGEYQEVVGTID